MKNAPLQASLVQRDFCQGERKNSALHSAANLIRGHVDLNETILVQPSGDQAVATVQEFDINNLEFKYPPP
jgi:hypothetical protein